jgi:hypothetical protein
MSKKSNYLKKNKKNLFLLSAKPEIVVPESDSGISFSKFPVSCRLLKLFYDENTQIFYLLFSQFRQKASGWINKTLLLIKQHIAYMNISRYANIDKFVNNIRYIFLLAHRAYSWLFQLAQMWELLAPGVGVREFVNPWMAQWHTLDWTLHIQLIYRSCKLVAKSRGANFCQFPPINITGKKGFKNIIVHLKSN